MFTKLECVNTYIGKVHIIFNTSYLQNLYIGEVHICKEELKIKAVATQLQHTLQSIIKGGYYLRCGV